MPVNSTSYSLWDCAVRANGHTSTHRLGGQDSVWVVFQLMGDNPTSGFPRVVFLTKKEAVYGMSELQQYEPGGEFCIREVMLATPKP